MSFLEFIFGFSINRILNAYQHYEMYGWFFDAHECKGYVYIRGLCNNKVFCISAYEALKRNIPNDDKEDIKEWIYKGWRWKWS